MKGARVAEEVTAAAKQIRKARSERRRGARARGGNRPRGRPASFGLQWTDRALAPRRSACRADPVRQQQHRRFHVEHPREATSPSTPPSEHRESIRRHAARSRTRGPGAAPTGARGRTEPPAARHDPRSSPSPTRRAASARPRRPSTSRPRSRSPALGCSSSTWIRRATPPPPSASSTVPRHAERLRRDHQRRADARAWCRRARSSTVCSCVPATIHLAGAEIELVSLVAREQRLRGALDRFLASEDEHPYHYVFIDCPPSLGLLTINAFVAAREVLIPIQCEYYALEGLSQLLNNIELIERHLNPHLAVSTILLTMYDSRTNLANQVAQEVREHFPDGGAAQRSSRARCASRRRRATGRASSATTRNSPGSLSYLEAAAEIARRGAPALMAAAPKRTGLGRGIGALIPTAEDPATAPGRRLLPRQPRASASMADLVAVPGARLANLSPDDIVPNPQQPRTRVRQRGARRTRRLDPRGRRAAADRRAPARRRGRGRAAVRAHHGRAPAAGEQGARARDHPRGRQEHRGRGHAAGCPAREPAPRRI